MSPLIFRSLGYDVTWAPLDSAELTGIGSVLDLYMWARKRTSSVVWGSGLRTSPTPEIRDAVLGSVASFVAVRGPKTRDALGLPESTTLGDPGLLAPALVEGLALRRGTHPVIVPHYRVWANPQSRADLKALASDGCRVIVPSEHPIRVVRGIAEAGIVYSSSLHGLIVADALGVPAALLRFEGTALSGEPEFKYADYFASVRSDPSWVGTRQIASAPKVLLDQIEQDSEARQRAAAALRSGLERSACLLSGVR
ncbi:ExoV-like protein [Mycolicibacterium canariasense]|uniref:ExoV-like protein n=2 Tax=Mycolicibacterium canariasense TaxID=228230 RepID=A0A117I8S8_MYCCR|nr:polysaccharide pyruvyl transferase family protein [Mycolicibacterium canariasense]ORV08755.1 hypothetical protein AWB94_11115 [Mycolicibacterium canariasense]GAS93709.1 ExoV-like protein [Mycolicibacterium canariasense]